MISTPKEKNTSVLTKFLYALGGFLFFLGIIILAVPTLVSTNWGNAQTIKIVNKKLSASINVRRINLAWFGPQEIEGFEMSNPNEQYALDFASLNVDVPLWRLLLNGFKFRNTFLTGLNAIFSQESGPPVILKNLNLQIQSDSNIEQTPIIAHIKGFTQQGKHTGQFDLDIVLTGIDPVGVMQRHASLGSLPQLKNQEHIQIRLNAQEIPSDLFDQILAIAKPKFARVGLIRSGLGETMNVTIDQTLNESQNIFDLHAESKNLRVKMTGELRSGLFSITEPGFITFTMTPEFFEHIEQLRNASEKLTLSQPAKLNLTIEKLSFPLQFLPEQAQIKYTASTDPITFSNVPGVGKLTINHYQQTMDGPSLVNAKWTSQAQILLHSPQDLWLKAFDDSIQFNMESPLRLHRDGTIDLEDLRGTFNSRYAQCVFNGCIKNSLEFYLTSPAVIYCDLLPMLKDIGVVKDDIIEATRVVLSIEPLNSPLNLCELEETHLFGKLSIDKIAIQGIENIPPAVFNQVIVPWEVNGRNNQVSLNVTSSTLLGRSEMKGSIQGKIIIDHWLNNGSLDLQKATLTAKTELSGESGNVTIDGQINHGILTLTQPLVAEVKATPKLGSVILRDLVPFLGEVLSADDPIKLTIDPKNFSIPIHPLDFHKVEINRMTLEMGKMYFHKNGELAKILSLFHREPFDDKLSVWFTPLYVSMSQGIIRVERIDMLALDRYPVAIWGKIDLPKDKVNMILGISQQALTYAFNFQHLDKNAMVQIPFKGTTRNAGIDKSKALAKISAIVAREQGGSKGSVLGTVLEIAGGALSEGKVPSPTINPLPWEIGKNEKKEEAYK